MSSWCPTHIFLPHCPSVTHLVSVRRLLRVYVPLLSVDFSLFFSFFPFISTGLPLLTSSPPSLPSRSSLLSLFFTPFVVLHSHRCYHSYRCYLPSLLLPFLTGGRRVQRLADRDQLISRLRLQHQHHQQICPEGDRHRPLMRFDFSSSLILTRSKSLFFNHSNAL